MKKKFSASWRSSKQIRKQRKFRANAPLHKRAKLMASNLNKELRSKYKRRSFPLRKDDSVRVMKGEFKGKKGKIALVDLKKLKVVIEGLQRAKKDGTKVNIIFEPSNLQIQELNLDDKKRIKSIEKEKAEEEKKEEKKEAETKEKTEKEEKRKEKKK